MLESLFIICLFVLALLMLMAVGGAVYGLVLVFQEFTGKPKNRFGA